MAESTIDIDGIPARYIAHLFIGELVNLATICNEKLNLDVTDTLILGCVVFFSSNRGLNETMDRGPSTTEDSGGNQLQHHAVIAKSIHLKLGMSRETVRRRLVHLESRGLLKKLDDGYFFPVQTGEDDVTRHLREYCVGAALRLRDQLTPYLPAQA